MVFLFALAERSLIADHHTLPYFTELTSLFAMNKLHCVLFLNVFNSFSPSLSVVSARIHLWIIWNMQLLRIDGVIVVVASRSPRSALQNSNWEKIGFRCVVVVSCCHVLNVFASYCSISISSRTCVTIYSGIHIHDTFECVSHMKRSSFVKLFSNKQIEGEQKLKFRRNAHLRINNIRGIWFYRLPATLFWHFRNCTTK